MPILRIWPKATSPNENAGNTAPFCDKVAGRKRSLCFSFLFFFQNPVQSGSGSELQNPVGSRSRNWIMFNTGTSYYLAEIITIRFASWISTRIVSLQPDTNIQKLLLNANRIRIRISKKFLTIFWGFRLLEKVAHCPIIHLLFPEASFQPSVPWLRVFLWCNLSTVVA